jgi:hypothetical protein
MAQASTFADSPRWRGEWSGPGRAAGGTGGPLLHRGKSRFDLRQRGCGLSRSAKTHVDFLRGFKTKNHDPAEAIDIVARCR